ncbi:MAG: hypothetical protein HY426_03495 [Candidatus Levybacteria bacterium]|nr:hypothetical protein [Candidatus Levybacteria bacterium]
MNTKNITSKYSRSYSIARTRSLNLTSNLARTNFNKYFQNLRNPNISKNHFAYAVVGVLLIAAFLIGRQFSPNTKSFLTGGDIREEAPAPIATQELNKKFEFPLKDESGKDVAKISYMVETANLQDAFIYQGKLAKAVKGRTFLIFNLKITNPYTKTIQINAKDYIRVRLNGKDEQLASEIHNDPVEIQANSTKYTRIGLPINDTDKNIVLLVGELQGDKETVSLNLSR